MKKLLDGIVEFRKNLTQENRELFATLSLGQKPDTLFIACSDSRVVPNLFASTNPGDLFVLRNIGNLIPPAHAPSQDNSALAVIEFAIFTLKVSDIIICGHSECGAMTLLTKDEHSSCCPHTASWIQYGKESLDQLKEGFTLDTTLSFQNQLSQINVLQQIAHIKSYLFVQDHLDKKKLRLHGWWFDIAKADVYSYEESKKKFVLIDEEEAQIIIQRNSKN